jgi:hypothetical protein
MLAFGESQSRAQGTQGTQGTQHNPTQPLCAVRNPKNAAKSYYFGVLWLALWLLVVCGPITTRETMAAEPHRTHFVQSVRVRILLTVPGKLSTLTGKLCSDGADGGTGVFCFLSYEKQLQSQSPFDRRRVESAESRAATGSQKM